MRAKKRLSPVLVPCLRLPSKRASGTGGCDVALDHRDRQDWLSAPGVPLRREQSQYCQCTHWMWPGLTEALTEVPCVVPPECHVVRTETYTGGE